jgi:DNA-binding NarL/FixJ family response regulator
MQVMKAKNPDGEREFEILYLHLAGLSNRQIAAKVGVSHPTVAKTIKTIQS